MSDVILIDSAKAQITTVGVTIKTLRVGTRQLTKAVYGQLPTCDLFDLMTLELEGEVWGWVNVNPDSTYRGRNFVVQKDGSLYRAPWPLLRLKDIDRHNSRHIMRSHTNGTKSFYDWEMYGCGNLLWSILAEGDEQWIGQYNSLMDWLESLEQLYIAA